MSHHDADAPDRTHIHMTQDHDVRYWLETLGASEWGLRDAIAAVGNEAEAVRKFLADR